VTPERWGPDPEPEPEPEPGPERYVVVRADTLKTLRELMRLVEHYPHLMPIVRQVLRVASIDPEGRILIGIRVVRELDDQ
jgi:hypothetical protein